MARQVFLFDPPTRFVAGTVGPPGDRTFFLQATDASRTVSVSLEKVQVAVLADRLEELLGKVAERRGGTAAASSDESGVIDETSGELVADVGGSAGADEEPTADVEPLASPVEEEFRVGAMGLAWDGDDDRIVVEAQAVTEDDSGEQSVLEDVEEGPDALRVRIDEAMARAFVDRVRLVVAAGRPPCPLCGMPLDAGGHICPRQNGYRRAH